jgi:hypothetical protein
LDLKVIESIWVKNPLKNHSDSKVASPKNKRRKNTRVSTRARSKGGTRTKRKVLSYILPLILAAFTILGGIFYLVPRLDISLDASSSNPLASPITLSNNGYLAVTIGDLYTSIDDLKIDNGATFVRCGTLYRGQGSTLRRGESADFVPRILGFRPEQKALSAHFLVIVRFHQQFWPWKLNKRVRFSIEPDAAGKLRLLRAYLTEADRKQDIP